MKRKNLYIILAAVVLAVLAALAAAGNSRVPEETVPETTRPLLQTIPTEEPTAEQTLGEDILVSTPYGELYLSHMWEEAIFAEAEYADDAYVITFWGAVSERNEALFAVAFGSGEGDPYGIVNGAGGTQAGIWFRVFPVPEDCPNVQKMQAMQEEINNILLQLEAFDGFERYIPAPEVPAERKTDTKYGELTVSEQWEENIRIKTSGNERIFLGKLSGKEVTLYTIVFGETGEDILPIGNVYADDGYVSVGVRIAEVQTWNDLDKAKAAAMQEELNHTVAQITGWSSFVS